MKPGRGGPPVSRLRAAIDGMDRENRALRAEVATAPLRRAARRLGVIAGGWLDRGVRKSQNAA